MVMSYSPTEETQESAVAQDDLIQVTPLLLFYASIPLIGVAAVSSFLELNLERPVIIGTIRTGIQLTICGYVLRPVFLYGERPSWDDFGWLLVAIYLFFMILLASWESSSRSKYAFSNMFLCILGSFAINVGLVSIFAFGYLIQPDPIWSPKYTIPITGMLLGNCVNGISLSLNSLLTDFKERANEVELLLSFGATIYEATVHLMRDAVLTGTMPMINNMSVIGIVALPGMMTGQILGGSSVIEAARYQILITYLIATCALGTILIELWIVRSVCCDLARQRLCTERLKLQLSGNRCSSGICEILVDTAKKCCRFFRKTSEEDSIGDIEAVTDLLTNGSSVKNGSTNRTSSIKLLFMRRGDGNKSSNLPNEPILELRKISRSLRDEETLQDFFLFQDVSLTLNPGDVVAITGPSGVGKSQLLRLVSGLSPLHNENFHGESYLPFISDMLLLGRSYRSFECKPVDWRRLIRYVNQHRIEIPGSPRMFVQRITSLASWQQIQGKRQDVGGEVRAPPSFQQMIDHAAQLVDSWGMDSSSCLDQEWKTLSGGESQRVYVAICLASMPKVLLMDESTNALDSVSKQQVERSVIDSAARTGAVVLWTSHDTDQIRRMTSSGVG